MSNPWDAVARLGADTVVTTSAGPPAGSWVTVDGAVFCEVAENGFGMLIAHCAGPALLRRLPERRQRRVRVTGGASTYRTEAFTQADHDAVADGVEGYLTDAGLPIPPRGWRWYQRPPAGHADLRELERHVNRRQQQWDRAATHPGEFAPLVARAVAEAYRL